MTSPKTIKRIESWTWYLIFGGLFLIVFAFILSKGGPGFNWYLGTVGTVATIAGAVLVWVRSRITPGP